LQTRKLRKYTDSIGLISLLGFILCLISGIVLIGYNIKTSPSSLESLTLVLVGTFIFEFFYRTFTTVRLKPYIDWRLEEGENFIKNFEYFLTLFKKNLKREFEDAEINVEGSINKGKEKAGFVRLRLTSKTPDSLKKRLPEILKNSHIKPYHPVEVVVEKKDD
jgi:hypothetical protein